MRLHHPKRARGRAHPAMILSALGILVMGSLFCGVGHGAEVVMKPGLLHSFEVDVPQKVMAGHPFSMTVRARDEFGNLKTDYHQEGSGILLRLAKGEGAIFPERLGPEFFQDGVARVELELSRAGDIIVRVQERDGLQEGVSAPFTVLPGPPIRFLVTAPGEVQASVPFRIKVVPVDAYRNLVSQFSPRGSLLLQSADGAPLEALMDSQELFRAGVAELDILCDKVGSFSLAVKSQDPECSGISDPIRVIPGRLNGFTISLPQQVVAGESIAATLVARDTAGNCVVDYGRVGGGLSLSLEGGGSVWPAFISSSAFYAGKAQVDVRFNVAGVTRLRAKDEMAGVEALSETVVVKSGPLHHFDVDVPATCLVGQPFTVKIGAKDVFENWVTDYERTGMGVSLSCSGSEDLETGFVPADRFDDGIAEVQICYPVAEAISLAASDRAGVAAGTSQPMVLVSGQAERFPVTVVSPAGGLRAGVPFSAVIEARDAFNNLVEDFSQSGAALDLISSGKGALSPNRIEASSFEKGVARVQCIYDTAEIFTLSAQLAGGTPATPAQEERVEARRPSLWQVNDLVEQREYRQAAALLKEMLDESPDDDGARQMLQRVDEIIRIMENGEAQQP